MPVTVEGSSPVSCYSHSERCLLEEGICVCKELHTWKSAVFRLWGRGFFC